MHDAILERRRVIYTGRVQGVGFRATAAEVALGHAVTGWVMNQEDGTVLLEVQGRRPRDGEAGEVEAFLAALRARMGRNIRREDGFVVEADGEERGFRIVRGA
jgi:acylphosphatase